MQGYVNLPHCASSTIVRLPAAVDTTLTFLASLSVYNLSHSMAKVYLSDITNFHAENNQRKVALNHAVQRAPKATNEFVQVDAVPKAPITLDVMRYIHLELLITFHLPATDLCSGVPLCLRFLVS